MENAVYLYAKSKGYRASAELENWNAISFLTKIMLIMLMFRFV